MSELKVTRGGGIPLQRRCSGAEGWVFRRESNQCEVSV